MTHSKFDLNVPRRCRDIASETAWHHAINFIEALYIYFRVKIK